MVQQFDNVIISCYAFRGYGSDGLLEEWSGPVKKYRDLEGSSSLCIMVHMGGEE
jgi:hypothetical protein